MIMLKERYHYEIRAIETENELIHYGRKGQRWGIRQYQYKDGSLTPLGRIHYGYGKAKETASKWAVRQKEKSEKRKEERELKNENEKQRLINHGTPDEIKKNISKFDNEDLMQIQRRFDTELKVRDNIEKLTSNKGNANVSSNNEKKSSIKQSITKGTEFLNKNTENLSKAIGNAKTFYNNVAVINNSLRKNQSGVRGLHAGDSGYITLIR